MQSPHSAGKGLFTQAAMVMLSRVPSPDEVTQALLLACPVEARVTRGGQNWCEGNSPLVLPFAPEKNGYLLVDIVPRLWPTALDSTTDEPEISAAWRAGHFGPLTETGSLSRAAWQSWKWKAGRQIQGKHEAFLRLRLTYLLGVSTTDKTHALTLTGAADPLAELQFMTQAAAALLTLRGALCIFYPGGEALRDAAFVEERLHLHRGGGPPPIEVWTNVRFQQVDTSSSWAIMDTVGMAQMGLPDIEAAFPQDKHERFLPPEVEGFLRNQSLRLLQDRSALVNPASFSGPGSTVWRSAGHLAAGFSAPAREVVRFLPRTLLRAPRSLRPNS